MLTTWRKGQQRKETSRSSGAASAAPGAAAGPLLLPGRLRPVKTPEVEGGPDRPAPLRRPVQPPRRLLTSR